MCNQHGCTRECAINKIATGTLQGVTRPEISRGMVDYELNSPMASLVLEFLEGSSCRPTLFVASFKMNLSHPWQA